MREVLQYQPKSTRKKKEKTEPQSPQSPPCQNWKKKILRVVGGLDFCQKWTTIFFNSFFFNSILVLPPLPPLPAARKKCGVSLFFLFSVYPWSALYYIIIIPVAFAVRQCVDGMSFNVDNSWTLPGRRKPRGKNYCPCASSCVLLRGRRTSPLPCSLIRLDATIAPVTYPRSSHCCGLAMLYEQWYNSPC